MSPRTTHTDATFVALSHGRSRSGKGVTQSRARAQRDKLDAQSQTRLEDERQPERSSSGEKHEEEHTRQRKHVTLERAIGDYLDDHEGGNHSDKTIEWHATALGLLRRFLEGRGITLVAQVDAPAISAWFASMRKTPGARENNHVLENMHSSTECIQFLYLLRKLMGFAHLWQASSRIHCTICRARNGCYSFFLAR